MDWESLLPTLPESIDRLQNGLEQHGNGTASYTLHFMHAESLLISTHAKADCSFMTCS